MTPIVLYPDIQFEADPAIERKVFAELELRTFRPSEQAAIPAGVWERAVALVCYHEIEVTAALLERMPRCRVVTRAGVGFDNIDIAEAGRRGIAVCNTPHYGTTEVADHAIAMSLAFLRGVAVYNELIADDPAGGWRYAAASAVRRLGAATFGVVGLGRIGTAAALRARALGMRVVFFDPLRTTGSELSLGLERAETLEALLGEADVVSLHTPLDATTRHLMGERELGLMKPDAILVNTGRGAVVDTVALARVMARGHLGGAALDVLEEEPPAPDHPLIEMWRRPGSPLRKKLLLSPHAAFYSPQSLIDLRRKSAETTLAWLRDGDSRDCVNRELLDGVLAARRAAAG